MCETLHTLSPQEKWTRYLATGDYDQISHPEQGYQPEDYVVARDGIGYRVLTVRETGEVVVYGKGGSTRTFRIDEIRPGKGIPSRMIMMGFFDLS